MGNALVSHHASRSVESRAASLLDYVLLGCTAQSSMRAQVAMIEGTAMQMVSSSHSRRRRHAVEVPAIRRIWGVRVRVKGERG